MLPDYTTAFWISAIAAVVLTGISKAGFGGGIGMIATPLMALTISVPQAAGIMLPLLIVADIFSVIQYRHTFDLRNVKMLLPGAIAGIVLGALAFRSLNDQERILKIGIGVIAVVFVLFQMSRALIFGIIKKHQPTVAEGIVIGGITGFVSTLAHAGGPPVAIYLLPQQLPRQIFVGTTVMFFACVNIIKLIPYHMLGLLNTGNLLTIALLSPLCFVGVRFGIYLNRKFSDVWFTRVIYAILFLTGLDLIIGKNPLELFK